MKPSLIVTAVLLVAAARLQARLVYSNDFSAGAGAEWSPAPLDVAPSGEQFLGRFLNDSAVSLTLESLPEHDTVTIAFDLYIIHSWDGSLFGADIWTLAVADGPTLLHTTFANPLDDSAENPQAFPGSYPSDLYPAQTGARNVNGLGYLNVAPLNFGDSTYHLSDDLMHTGDGIQFVFVANGFTGVPLPYGLGDESWGIDNVVVSVAPEPCGALGCSFGTLIVLRIPRRGR